MLLPVLINLGFAATASGTAEVVEAEDNPTGGWAGFWNDYERERRRREREKREREAAEARTAAIEGDLERAIAEELRKAEAEAARRAELARFNRMLAARRSAIIAATPETVGIAVERALAQQNFSAIEAAERLLLRQREEELFMIEAAMILMEGA